MKRIRPLFIFSFILAATALLAAYGSPDEPVSPDCTGNGIAIISTAIRQTDPDLFSSLVPLDTGNGADYCPTPNPDEDFPGQFITTEVINLSLDTANQELAIMAVGDDILAAAWLSGGDNFVILSQNGNYFQVCRVDSRSGVSLVLSRATRMHVSIEQDGRILNRAADQGACPADLAQLQLQPLTNGRILQVVVKELNRTHILYEQDFKFKHLPNQTRPTQFVAYATNPIVMPF